MSSITPPPPDSSYDVGGSPESSNPLLSKWQASSRETPVELDRDIGKDHEQFAEALSQDLGDLSKVKFTVKMYEKSPGKIVVSSYYNQVLGRWCLKTTILIKAENEAGKSRLLLKEVFSELPSEGTPAELKQNELLLRLGAPTYGKSRLTTFKQNQDLELTESEQKQDVKSAMDSISISNLRKVAKAAKGEDQIKMDVTVQTSDGKLVTKKGHQTKKKWSKLGEQSLRLQRSDSDVTTVKTSEMFSVLQPLLGPPEASAPRSSVTMMGSHRSGPIHEAAAKESRRVAILATLNHIEQQIDACFTSKEKQTKKLALDKNKQLVVKGRELRIGGAREVSPQTVEALIFVAGKITEARGLGIAKLAKSQSASTLDKLVEKFLLLEQVQRHAATEPTFKQLLEFSAILEPESTEAKLASLQEICKAIADGDARITLHMLTGHRNIPDLANLMGDLAAFLDVTLKNSKVQPDGKSKVAKNILSFAKLYLENRDSVPLGGAGLDTLIAEVKQILAHTNTGSLKDLPERAELKSLLSQLEQRSRTDRGPTKEQYTKALARLANTTPSDQDINFALTVERQGRIYLAGPTKNDELAELQQQLLSLLKAEAKEAPTGLILSKSTKESYPILRDLFAESFARLEPSELDGLAWSKGESKHILAPNLLASIDQFNAIQKMVALEILNSGDRKQAIARTIKLMKRACREHQYGLAISLMAALNHSAIRRLKSDFPGESSGLGKAFDKVAEELSSNGNYKKLRQRINLAIQAKQNVSLFSGVYQTDMTFVTDGNKDQLEGQINLRKIKFCSDIKTRVREAKTKPSFVSKTPELKAQLSVGWQLYLIGNDGGHSDDLLYRKSLEVSPRK